MSRHRFDHAAALAVYLALDAHERTYAEVARRCGVSESAIRAVARKEAWEAALAKAQADVIRKAIRTRTERSEKLARIVDRMSDRIDDGIDDAPFDLVLARFGDIHRVYRLEAGEATDHVAFAEVQAGFRTVIEVGARWAVRTDLPVGELRAGFLAEVNEALAVSGATDDGGSA